MNMSLNIKKRDFDKEIQDIEEKLKQLNEEKQVRTNRINEMKSSLKNRKVKSVKEQKEELQKQVKKNIAQMSAAKKKISHLEVQI